MFSRQKIDKMMKKISNFFRRNLLTNLTILGVLSGVLLGFLLRLRPEQWTQREIMYINFIGDIFLRMLKGLIIPLIVSSLISAIGSLNVSLSGKIGGRAIIYYLVTTVMAVTLGIIIVSVVQPGKNASSSSPTTTENIRNVTTIDTLLDLVRNLFPPNLVQACFVQYQTVLIPPKNYTTDLDNWEITSEYSEGMNILGLVVISCVFGIAISVEGEKSQVVLKFIQEFSELMMKLTGWVIWFSPLGVLFLIAGKFMEMENMVEVMGSLGLYFITVLGGVLFHGFLILPMIYFGCTRKNPYKFLSGMTQALATAFGTSSSSATLPVTIQCLENNNRVDQRVSRFVLPVGATINMDGTALYEAVAAIFIAQIRGIALTFGNIIAISITATLASIGAAGIPQAGLVTMVMVLDVVGLPASDVSLIIAVDWLLDRFRTMINVLGDAFGAGIVEHLSRKQLRNDEEIIDNAAKTMADTETGNE